MTDRARAMVKRSSREPFRRRRQHGFSLVELMVVVLIIGVLAAIAYPSYTRYVERTRIAEMKGQLLELSSELERYRARHFSYKGAALATLSPALSASNFYTVTLTVSGSPHQSYVIQAIPRGMMAGTGSLVLDSRGQRCYGGRGNDSACSPGGSGWDD